VEVRVAHAAVEDFNLDIVGKRVAAGNLEGCERGGGGLGGVGFHGVHGINFTAEDSAGEKFPRGERLGKRFRGPSAVARMEFLHPRSVFVMKVFNPHARCAPKRKTDFEFLEKDRAPIPLLENQDLSTSRYSWRPS
jgi:hypothetical protein